MLLQCTHLSEDDVRPEPGESLLELLDLLPVPHQVHSLQPHAVGDLYHSPPHRAVRPVLRQRTVTESITVYYSTCTTQSPGFKGTKSRSILSAVQGFTIMVAAPMAGMSLRTGIQSSCRDTECDTQVPDIGFPGSTFTTVHAIQYSREQHSTQSPGLRLQSGPVVTTSATPSPPPTAGSAGRMG